MQTRTLDNVIRDTLNQMGYPLHFYTQALLYAIREYEEMQKMFPFKAKQVEKTLTDFQRVSLPDDLDRIISVSVKRGEYLLTLVKDDTLNRLYRYDDSGNKIAYPDTNGTDFLGNFFIYDDNGSATITLEREYLGRQYGYARGQEYTFSFDRANQELVFSNKVTFESVVITYSSISIETSAVNLIDHKHVDRVEKAIKYNFAKYVKMKPQDVGLALKEYKDAKRVLRAREYPITYQDLMYYYRQSIHQGIKN